MSELAARPLEPVVGVAVPHESAVLHSTGTAMYTDDLAAADGGVLTAWPVQSAQAHAHVTLDVAPALVPLMPSMTRCCSSSKRSSTPQVKAPWLPPP